jgi:ABC-2 type transport system ATP-binding protein
MLQLRTGVSAAKTPTASSTGYVVESIRARCARNCAVHTRRIVLAEPTADRERCGVSEDNAVVSVRSLTKRYGNVHALEQLTFALQPGTITGFLGPNGAGKTTCLRLLLGLARPTSGEALVFGRQYQQLEHPTRRVGAVLESSGFDPGRSGRNHLRALAIATGVPSSRVDDLLALVDLAVAADRRVKTYSLGMRQRLGLAAALLGDPELLLLDEPANGLDAAGVHWLRNLLRQLAMQGRTVLICSHDLAEIAQTVDQAIVIKGGRLVAILPLEEFIDGRRSLEDRYLELTAPATA